MPFLDAAMSNFGGEIKPSLLVVLLTRTGRWLVVVGDGAAGESKSPTPFTFAGERFAGCQPEHCRRGAGNATEIQLDFLVTG